MTRREPDRITADDGHPLRATWYRPDHAPRGAVLVAPAMATRPSFYAAFAAALADQGFLVLTFGYRGTEPHADPRRIQADILTWASDAAAALEALHAELDRTGSDVPITWLGHSLGGQILGFVDHSVAQKLILVATGHGYWRHNPPWLRRWVRLFWHAVAPLSVRIAGYYPGRRLRFLDDLPAGVMMQWRRWCLHPGYWAADVPDIRDRHAQIEAPVTAVHLTDDEIITRAGIEALLAQFTSTSTDLTVLSPDDIGASKVGHHGLFRAEHARAWSRHLFPLVAAQPQHQHNAHSAP